MATHHYDVISIKSFREALKQLRLVNRKYHEQADLIVDFEQMLITYKDMEMEFEATPCNYGGERYWFRCPGCNKRCSKLYRYTGISYVAERIDFKEQEMYACGDCRDMYKFTLNRTKTDCAYYYLQAEKEARKVDSRYKYDGANVRTMPNRPKRMKRSKYNYHKQRFNDYMAKGDRLLMNSWSR